MQRRNGFLTALFFTDTDLNLLPLLPLGTDLAHGIPATLDSDGTTATLTIAAPIWGPLVKQNADSGALGVGVVATCGLLGLGRRARIRKLGAIS